MKKTLAVLAFVLLFPMVSAAQTTTEQLSAMLTLLAQLEAQVVSLEAQLASTAGTSTTTMATSTEHWFALPPKSPAPPVCPGWAVNIINTRSVYGYYGLGLQYDPSVGCYATSTSDSYRTTLSSINYKGVNYVSEDGRFWQSP